MPDDSERIERDNARSAEPRTDGNGNPSPVGAYHRELQRRHAADKHPGLDEERKDRAEQKRARARERAAKAAPPPRRRTRVTIRYRCPDCGSADVWIGYQRAVETVLHPLPRKPRDVRVGSCRRCNRGGRVEAFDTRDPQHPRHKRRRKDGP